MILLLGSVLHTYSIARADYIGPPLVLNPDCVLDVNWLLPTANACATAPEGLVNCCNCVYDETFWLNTLKVAKRRVDYEEKCVLGTWDSDNVPIEPLTYDRDSLRVPMEADEADEIRSRTTGWRAITFMCRIILPDDDMDKVLPLVETKRTRYPRDTIKMIVHCPVTESFVRLESRSKRKFGPLNANGDSDQIVVSGRCLPTSRSRRNIDLTTVPQKMRVGYEDTKPRRKHKKAARTHIDLKATSKRRCTELPRPSLSFAQQNMAFTALTTSTIDTSFRLGEAQFKSRSRLSRNFIDLDPAAVATEPIQDFTARDTGRRRPVAVDSITLRLSTVSTQAVPLQRDYIIDQAFGSAQVSTSMRDWSRFGGGTGGVGDHQIHHQQLMHLQACVSDVPRDADLTLSAIVRDRNAQQD